MRFSAFSIRTAACFSGFFQRAAFALMYLSDARRFENKPASAAYHQPDFSLTFGALLNGRVLHALFSFETQTAFITLIFVSRHN
jgi:hypothetical protein